MSEYFIPSSAPEALALLASYQGAARVIAGGTDLAVDLREGKKQASALVDITQIAELRRIEVADSQVEIGAGVTFAQIKAFDFFWRHIPALAQAAGSVGAGGIQTRATLAGNLIQAMPAADGAIIALALDAEACVADSSGERWLPVGELFAGPGRSTLDSTRQLVTRLRFALPERAWGVAWQRVGRRTALVLPTLNCAVKLTLAGGRIERAIIAIGPAGRVPFRAAQAEEYLVGREPLEAVFAEAGRIARQEANPRGNPLRASREYRLQIVEVLTRRALSEAFARAAGESEKNLDAAKELNRSL